MNVWFNFLTFEKMCIKKLYKLVCMEKLRLGGVQLLATYFVKASYSSTRGRVRVIKEGYSSL